jgi:hypothetical protein
MANSGVIATTRDAAPDAWRRLVGYLLQAFAVRDQESVAALRPGPAPAALYRAMFRPGA